ncbi:hypothetical protein AAT19DRAFT_13869 [Rhodotorula toruloides]|uniref:Uncharacterized protein n=1 Tax=Rhodotorula toruloides TaxID=5286 RepID=A0A2T0AA07_RHOTO|nr:hypothetical protein AAT19DRAFT_13869 [Rhodotorula toruloides]
MAAPNQETLKQLTSLFRQPPFSLTYDRQHEPLEAIFIYLVRELQVHLLGVSRDEATYTPSRRLSLAPGFGTADNPIDAFMPAIPLKTKYTGRMPNQRFVQPEFPLDGKTTLAGPRLLEVRRKKGNGYEYPTRVAKDMAKHYSKSGAGPYKALSMFLLPGQLGDPNGNILPYTVQVDVVQRGDPLDEVQDQHRPPKTVEFDCDFQRLEDGKRWPVVNFRLHLALPDASVQQSLGSLFDVDKESWELKEERRQTHRIVSGYGGEGALRRIFKVAIEQFSKMLLNRDLTYDEASALQISPGAATAEQPIPVHGPAVPLEVYESKAHTPRFVLFDRHMRVSGTSTMAGPRLVESNRSGSPWFTTQTGREMSKHYAQRKEGMFWLHFMFMPHEYDIPFPAKSSIAQEGDAWRQLQEPSPPQTVALRISIEPLEADKRNLIAWFRLELLLPDADAQHSLAKGMSSRRGFEVGARRMNEASPSVLSW